MRRIKRKAIKTTAKRINGDKVLEGFITANHTLDARKPKTLFVLAHTKVFTKPISNGIDHNRNHCKLVAQESGTPEPCFIIWMDAKTNKLQAIAHYVVRKGNDVIDPISAVRGEEMMYLFVEEEVISTIEALK